MNLIFTILAVNLVLLSSVKIEDRMKSRVLKTALLCLAYCSGNEFNRRMFKGNELLGWKLKVITPKSFSVWLVEVWMKNH